MNNKDIVLLHKMIVKPDNFGIIEQHIVLLSRIMKSVLANRRATGQQMTIFNKYKKLGEINAVTQAHSIRV